MPSPFPRMDPFIESQRWHGFHATFVPAIARALVPQVRPRYVVDVEQYVFLSWDDEEGADEVIRVGPDVHIAAPAPREVTAVPRPRDVERGTGPVVTADWPVTRTIPLPRRRRQPFVVIRNRDMERVVTAIEVLSPKNKRAGEGHEDYDSKRQNILYADANLVEIDLLRAGIHPPTNEPLPAGDFFAFVIRRDDPSLASVYAWGLRDRLPTIPIPLGPDDAEAVLDLQAVFTSVYDENGYDYSLKYDRRVIPALSDADAAWVRDRLNSNSSGSRSSSAG